MSFNSLFKKKIAICGVPITTIGVRGTTIIMTAMKDAHQGYAISAIQVSVPLYESESGYSVHPAVDSQRCDSH